MATLQIDLEISIECEKCGNKSKPKFNESSARIWAITNGWHINYINDTAICSSCRTKNLLGIKNGKN